MSIQSKVKLKLRVDEGSTFYLLDGRKEHIKRCFERRFSNIEYEEIFALHSSAAGTTIELILDGLLIGSGIIAAGALNEISKDLWNTFKETILRRPSRGFGFSGNDHVTIEIKGNQLGFKGSVSLERGNEPKLQEFCLEGFPQLVKIGANILRGNGIPGNPNYSIPKGAKAVTFLFRDGGLFLQEHEDYYQPIKNIVITNNSIRTILILASNPNENIRLRLDKEVSEIDEGLRRSKYREKFVVEQRWAVEPDNWRRAMLDFEPQIVHFCGHGTGIEGLILEDHKGNAKLVSSDSLAGLFRLFAAQVECVVLNACYSHVQAKAIASHINYVVGMNEAIGDRAAIQFSKGFYDALGAGRSYESAYEFGCNAIDMQGIPEYLTPKLIRK